MIETNVVQQITENIGAGEEVRFSRSPHGLRIRRIHGDKEIEQLISPIQIQTMRLLDEYLGERLWDMAITLRSN